MVYTVFIEFLNWFKQLTAGRKVLLILDGYSAYHTGLDLWLTSSDATDNIRVAFFPFNTTSYSQSFDQDIIRIWKAYYRKRWI
jgi:DDE superfamily endonuclease